MHQSAALARMASSPARLECRKRLRDVWELFRTVIRERKSREFDPTVGMLTACVNDPDFAAEDPGARKRIADTLALMNALSSWGEEMLRLEPATLMKIMKLGSRIQKLLREGRKTP